MRIDPYEDYECKVNRVLKVGTNSYSLYLDMPVFVFSDQKISSTHELSKFDYTAHDLMNMFECKYFFRHDIRVIATDEHINHFNNHPLKDSNIAYSYEMLHKLMSDLNNRLVNIKIYDLSERPARYGGESFNVDNMKDKRINFWKPFYTVMKVSQGRIREFKFRQLDNPDGKFKI